MEPLILLYGVGVHALAAFLAGLGSAASQSSTDRTERGRIAPGARADLVLGDGNPLEYIQAARAIVRVFKNGYEAPRTPGETNVPAASQ